jgi:hypothetical protein
MIGPRLLSASLLGLVLFAVPRVSAAAADNALAAGVTWDVTGALAGGSACSNGVDAFVMQNASDLTMVFSNLGVALNAGAPQSGEGACSVQVNAVVPAGLYPSSVTQTYEYGVTRTSGSTGRLAASVQFLGIPVSPLPLTVSTSGPHLLATRTDTFDNHSPWFAKWCAPTRMTSGPLTASFRAQATTTTAADSIVLFVNGLGLKYDFSTTWHPCT